MPVRTLLATTEDGVVRATRRGDSNWAVARSLSGQAVITLASVSTIPGVVYAGTQSGAWRSDDGGRTWRASGLAGRQVTAIAVSPHDAGIVYAGVRPRRLVISQDAGGTWAEMEGFRRVPGRWTWFSPASFPFSAYVQGIVPSLADPAVLTVGVEFGATVRTTDGGESWSGHLRGSLRDCHSLIGHATDPDWLYEAGGTGAGVAVSDDGGRTWRQSRVGLDRHYGWACAADPGRPEIWYASLSPGPKYAHSANDARAAIYRVEPTGWERLAGGLPQPLPFMPYGLVTDPTAPGHVYAGLANGDVWHSADHGDTWTLLPLSLGPIHRTMIALS